MIKLQVLRYIVMKYEPKKEECKKWQTELNYPLMS